MVCVSVCVLMLFIYLCLLNAFDFFVYFPISASKSLMFTHAILLYRYNVQVCVFVYVCASVIY